MTNFVHVDYPTEHPGVVRAENAAAALKGIAAGFDSARGAASLMLAAVVSGLLVLANQVVDRWTDGHLLSAWIVLWLVAFAALALLSAPARRAGLAVRAGFARWAESQRHAAEDRRTWQVALRDPRIMAELNHGLTDLRKFY
ncbi:hypothetical protein HNP48_000285 [Acidovorax soli]|uniref:Uncharacterized protein n=1 Tax=Acidovorax soli TaxID=592050 RepID=A0A7X0P9A0_9BURK|nr:hypothetical protein [Acidovorax soli]MBB6557621.1 hypothetical protein [Acidovorax soli]